MGLLIPDKVGDSGALEEYWKVLGININAQYKWTDIKMGAYHTQEARDKGFEPIRTKTVRANWSDEEYNKYFSPESFGNANPIASMKAFNLASQEEIENAIFLESNIFERAYAYVKQREKEFTGGLNA